MTDIRDYAGRWIPEHLRATEEATHWFLESLYIHCFGVEGAHLELRPVPTWNAKPEKNQEADPCRVWLPLRNSDDIALATLETHRIARQVKNRRCKDTDMPGQLYYGVQPRTFQGGKHDDVIGFVGVYADLELRKKNIAPRDAAMGLSRLSIPPSALIWSGNGMHAYWFLNNLAPKIDRARVEALIRGIAHKLAAFGSDKSVLDGPRILRLPGTVNRKATPIPVQLLWMNPERRYKLWQVEDAFPVPDLPPAYVPRVVVPNKDFRPPQLEWQGDWHHSVMHHLSRCRAFGASDSDIEIEAQKCAKEWGRHGQKSLNKALKMAKWVNGHPPGEPMRKIGWIPASYTARGGEWQSR